MREYIQSYSLGGFLGPALYVLQVGCSTAVVDLAGLDQSTLLVVFICFEPARAGQREHDGPAHVEGVHDPSGGECKCLLESTQAPWRIEQFFGLLG